MELLGGKVSSRGGQLVTNGNGILGDNTNFSKWTYDPTNACNGSNGAFTRSSRGSPILLDEYVTLMGGVDYCFECDMKSLNGLAIVYGVMMFLDVDKNQIAAYQVMYVKDTLTTLTQDLKPGDTVVHFADLSKWSTNTTIASQRGFIVWNYTNSYGYTYPPETYSRNRYISLWTDANVDKMNNTITLTNAWNGDTIPAGTKLSQGDSGATYKYIAMTNKVMPVSVMRHGR